MGWYSNAVRRAVVAHAHDVLLRRRGCVRGSTSLASAAMTFGPAAPNPSRASTCAQRVGGGELLLDTGLARRRRRRRPRAAARTGSGWPAGAARGGGRARSATGSGGGANGMRTGGGGGRRGRLGPRRLRPRAFAAASGAWHAGAAARLRRGAGAVGARRRRDQLAGALRTSARQRLLPASIERLRRRLHVQDLARRRAAVEEEDVDVDADQPDQHDAQPQRPFDLASAASTSLSSCQYRPGA